MMTHAHWALATVFGLWIANRVRVWFVRRRLRSRFMTAASTGAGIRVFRFAADGEKTYACEGMVGDATMFTFLHWPRSAFAATGILEIDGHQFGGYLTVGRGGGKDIDTFAYLTRCLQAIDRAQNAAANPPAPEAPTPDRPPEPAPAEHAAKDEK